PGEVSASGGNSHVPAQLRLEREPCGSEANRGGDEKMEKTRVKEQTVSVKAAAFEGGKGSALVSGYGAIGILVEGVVAHHWPWLGQTPGVITTAVTSIIHGVQSGIMGWLNSRGA